MCSIDVASIMIKHDKAEADLSLTCIDLNQRRRDDRDSGCSGTGSLMPRTRATPEHKPLSHGLGPGSPRRSPPCKSAAAEPWYRGDRQNRDRYWRPCMIGRDRRHAALFLCQRRVGLLGYDTRAPGSGSTSTKIRSRSKIWTYPLVLLVPARHW